MVFLSKEQVLNLFDKFEIIDFQENERDGKTGLGKIKHWHTFDIIAKKREQTRKEEKRKNEHLSRIIWNFF